MASDVCEHGGLRRKCDICDLTADVQQLRDALMVAERALIHARIWIDTAPVDVRRLIADALAEVTGVLDIGRDERNEQGGT